MTCIYRYQLERQTPGVRSELGGADRIPVKEQHNRLMKHEPDRATYKYCATKASTSSVTKLQIQATKQRSDNTVEEQCRCPGHKTRGFKMAFVLKDCEEWFSILGLQLQSGLGLSFRDGFSDG